MNAYTQWRRAVARVEAEIVRNDPQPDVNKGGAYWSEPFPFEIVLLGGEVAMEDLKMEG